MQIKPLNSYWVVVKITGYPVMHTIGTSEEEGKLLFGKIINWPAYESLGYKCVKVDINFTVKE